MPEPQTHDSSIPEDLVDNMVDMAILKTKLEGLEKTVESLKHDRDSALRWGIITLGTAVVGMASWIWDHLTEILQVLQHAPAK